MVDGCAGRPARTGRFLAFDSPTSFIAGHTSAARGAGLRKLARTAPLKVLRGSRRRSSRISGTRFCIPRQDSRDTGWDRGTGGTAANSQTFGGTERWDRWDHHGRLPIRVDSPGRIGPTCQYHLFAPIPVEYHRSHPSPPKKLSREMKMELRIMPAP